MFSRKTTRVVILLGIVLFGGGLRLNGLGLRSLWADEFCTWRVSRMPLYESLRWGPELTKPPLYQLCLRAITAESKPGESVLRMPAAVGGILVIVAVWWLGTMTSGWTVGCSAALLFSCNELQIDYSQEARSYSMLVLGSILSTGLWFRLVTERQGTKFRRPAQETGAIDVLPGSKSRWCIAPIYVVVTVLAFHAHYLILLTVAAQAIWWVMRPWGPTNNPSLATADVSAPRDGRLAGPVAMVVVGLLCVPIVRHYFRFRTSAFQGLDWIAPPTWTDAIAVLERLTFGPVWVWALLLPAVLILIAAWIRRAILREASNASSVGGRRRFPTLFTVIRQIDAPTRDICGLLSIWLGTGWFGLMVISWLAHPAIVERYALPAAVPAILLPLIVAHRIDARAPVVIAGAFFVGSVGQWTARSENVMPGFREMVAFLNQVVDPQRDAVAVVIERTTSPGWEEMDRLGFEYYPSRNADVHELYLRNGELDGYQPILDDARALYLVSFLANPEKAVESSGRKMNRIHIDNQSVERLLFSPYRLMLVAPRQHELRIPN